MKACEFEGARRECKSCKSFYPLPVLWADRSDVPNATSGNRFTEITFLRNASLVYRKIHGFGSSLLA